MTRFEINSKHDDYIDFYDNENKAILNLEELLIWLNYYDNENKFLENFIHDCLKQKVNPELDPSKLPVRYTLKFKTWGESIEDDILEVLKNYPMVKESIMKKLEAQK